MVAANGGFSEPLRLFDLIGKTAFEVDFGHNRPFQSLYPLWKYAVIK